MAAVMNRQEFANKNFNLIMELQGVDEFKIVLEHLRIFQQNKEKYSVPDVTLPNYLWIAKRGGGISTCINAFAEYLYNAKVIEFSGIVKYFEYKLAYIDPDTFFSELTRLNNTISEIAGHHRYFRGLACINIDDWAEHTNERYFYKFLDYIASKNDKILAILYVHTDNKRIIESIESSLSSRIRFESISLRFPNVSELITFIEAKYFKKRGFKLTDDAKSLLTDSIEAIINGKHFNGFTTIKQLANDILYSLLASNISGYDISADMLCGFNKDSAYIKRIKTFVGTSSTIGFVPSLEDYSR
jgi:hypothetical protein